MSIDPKKGGLCWHCTYCEDVATQTDNPSGSYYRKCSKSGHEYVDTCRFHCSDYVWDGKTERYYVPSSSSSSSSSSYSSTSKPAPKATSTVGFKLIATLITTAIFGYLAYMLKDSIDSGVFFLDNNKASLVQALVILAPFVVSIILGLIRRRKIWIPSLLTILACTGINSVIGDATTQNHIPLYVACLILPYLCCLFAILKEKN